MRFISLAIVSIASSQLICSNSPESALADALHGIVQAIGALKPTADGTPAQAGTQLGLVHCGIARVIGFHIRDLLVAHMTLQRARAAAIDRAMRPNDLVLGRSRFGFLLGLRSRRTSEHGRASRRRIRARPGAETLHERRRDTAFSYAFSTFVPPSSVEVFRRCGAGAPLGPSGERTRGTCARTFSPPAFAIGENLTPQACAPCHIKCMNFMKSPVQNIPILRLDCNEVNRRRSLLCENIRIGIPRNTTAGGTG